MQGNKNTKNRKLENENKIQRGHENGRVLTTSSLVKEFNGRTFKKKKPKAFQ